MGQGTEALDYFNQALPLWQRSAGERGGEALTLNNMGRAYADLGKKQKALETYNQALSIWREVGNRQGEASTLNNIGRLYRDLGQQQSALDYYNQALPVMARSGKPQRRGAGAQRYRQGLCRPGHQPTKGAGVLRAGAAHLARDREPARRSHDAEQYGPGLFQLWGMAGKALEFDIQALPIWREVEDRRGEAVALMTIGWAYSEQKEVAFRRWPVRAGGIVFGQGCRRSGDREGGIENIADDRLPQSASP
jgi:tetratricopeptide (TPR) repeat protein